MDDTDLLDVYEHRAMKSVYVSGFENKLDNNLMTARWVMVLPGKIILKALTEAKKRDKILSRLHH